MARRKIAEIRIGVGTPVAKTVPEHHGGPVVAFQLRDSQQVPVTLEALDSEGNPAAQSTAWTTSDASVADVQDLGGGEALIVASPGAAGLGTATITATVTDTSDGDTHVATLDVEVVAGDAVTFNLIAGEPEDKPA